MGLAQRAQPAESSTAQIIAEHAHITITACVSNAMCIAVCSVLPDTMWLPVRVVYPATRVPCVSHAHHQLIVSRASLTMRSTITHAWTSAGIPMRLPSPAIILSVYPMMAVVTLALL